MTDREKIYIIISFKAENYPQFEHRSTYGLTHIKAWAEENNKDPDDYNYGYAQVADTFSLAAWPKTRPGGSPTHAEVFGLNQPIKAITAPKDAPDDE